MVIKPTSQGKMKMKFHFLAKIVTTSLTDGAHVVGFADSSDEPHNYLLLQRGCKFDAQDKELGQDTYYVEIGGQDRAGYGGVNKVTVSSSKIEFSLDPSTLWTEGLDSIEITFAPTSADHSDIKKALNNIFHGETNIISEGL